MFNVSSVITFSVFLELLRKSTLLVRYKLNILWPPRVKQFDICVLLFHRLRQVHIDKLNGIFCWWKNLPSGSYLISQLAWNCFCCVMGSYCSLFNYPLGIILIVFAATCGSIILFVIESILFYWILTIWYCFNRAFMWRQFVSFKEFVRSQTKFTSSSGINLFGLSILEVIPCLMLTISFISQHYKSFDGSGLYLQVYSWYDIPYVMYWTYAHMDVALANPMQC